jgi:hypothetical protein
MVGSMNQTMHKCILAPRRPITDLHPQVTDSNRQDTDNHRPDTLELISPPRQHPHMGALRKGAATTISGHQLEIQTYGQAPDRSITSPGRGPTRKVFSKTMSAEDAVALWTLRRKNAKCAAAATEISF